MSRPGRKSYFLLTILLLIGLVAFVLYQRQRRRIEAQTDIITTEIIANHTVWLNAIETADRELFLYSLSSLNATWKQAQGRLFTIDAVLGRTSLGMVKDNFAEEEPYIEIAPDWQTATLTHWQTYEHEGAEFRLQHSRHYWREATRWVHSGPPEDYWGAWQIYSTEYLELTYPAREQLWAERFASDLHDELARICNSRSCSAVTLKMTTDPLIFEELSAQVDTPIFEGRTFLLPAPSLVGLPEDDAGYMALYEGYAERILPTVEASVDTPIPLPDQDVVSLCFTPESVGMNLYRYDLVSDSWDELLPEMTFAYMQAMPDDGGLILQEAFPGREAGRLRIIKWEPNGNTTTLYDQETRARLNRAFGWAEPHTLPHLTLQTHSTATRNTFEGWLDLTACDGQTCPLIETDGYVTWSPTGQHTLIVHRRAIYLGDDSGQQVISSIGVGYSPFWLSDTQFGYVGYTDNGETTVFIGDTSGINPQPLSLNEQITTITQSTNPFLINYVTPHPSNPILIYMAGRTIGENSQYYTMQINLSSNTAKHIFTLDSAPSGIPTLLSPTGYPSFQITPDGTWLYTTQLTGQSDWHFYLSHLPTEDLVTLSVGYPSYPARFPYFDWTLDNQWLIIAEENYFRLVSPNLSYERLITHPFDTCLFTHWQNK